MKFTEMYKLLISLSILTISVIPCIAQHATIKGKITNGDGKPAEFLNVELKGTNKGGMSDETGEYKIENINPGTYTLVVTGIGIRKRSEAIVIIQGQDAYRVDLTVEEGSQHTRRVTDSSADVVTANTAGSRGLTP